MTIPFKSVLLLPLLGLTVSGCTRTETRTRTITVTKVATPTPAPVESSGADGAPDAATNAPEIVVSEVSGGGGKPDRAPAAGKSNAVGRVLFDGEGVADIDVKMCDDVGGFSGCRGASYEAKTNADGYYLIDNVPPGSYGLMVRVFKTNKFVYPMTGIMTASKFKLQADKTLAVRNVNLWKRNLKATTPVNGTTVSEARPRLAWDEYPGAHNYKVRLRSTGGGTVSFPRLETGLTNVTPDRSLLNGNYTWEVEAYNVEGTKIAETASRSNFKVSGQKGSNKVELLTPARSAKVGSSGLVLKWTPNPLADEYRVYLKGSGQKKSILGFKSQIGTSKKIDQTLPSGKYYWSVNAYKERRKIAGSGIQYFTVN